MSVGSFCPLCFLYNKKKGLVCTHRHRSVHRRRSRIVRMDVDMCARTPRTYLRSVASSILSGTKWPSSTSCRLRMSRACFWPGVRFPSRPGRGLKLGSVIPSGKGLALAGSRKDMVVDGERGTQEEAGESVFETQIGQRPRASDHVHE